MIHEIIHEEKSMLHQCFIHDFFEEHVNVCVLESGIFHEFYSS